MQASSNGSGGAIPGVTGEGEDFEDGSEAYSAEIKARQSAEDRVEVGS